MIKIRKANNNDKEAWNEVVKKAENSTYAHTWEWKEVIEKGFNGESLCLVAEDNTGEIAGIYPGFLQPLKINLPFAKKFKNLESPFSTTWDYGGPCILPDTDKKVLEELVIGMERLAKEKGAISLRISPFEGDALKNTILKRGYRISERLTWVIDLTKSEEELMGNIKTDAKKGVKKAIKEGITVTCENSNFNEVYKCLQEVHKEHNIPLPEIKSFEVLSKLFQNMLKIYTAKADDKIIGTSIGFHFKDVYVEKWRSSLFDYRKLYPDNALVWSSLMDMKSHGCKVFDFGGAGKSSKGIYFFKSRWGGEIKNVDWYIKDIKFNNIRALMRKFRGYYEKQ